MKKIFTIVLASVGAMLMAGCAPMISGAMNASLNDDKLIEKTADYFGVKRDEINVSSIEKNVLTTDYKVRHNGQLYNCNIYYGAVSCKKPGG